MTLRILGIGHDFDRYYGRIESCSHVDLKQNFYFYITDIVKVDFHEFVKIPMGPELAKVKQVYKI